MRSLVVDNLNGDFGGETASVEARFSRQVPGMKKLGYLFQGHRPYLLSGVLFGLSYPSYPYVRWEVLAWVWMVPMLLALKSETSFGQFLGYVYLATLVDCVLSM